MLIIMLNIIILFKIAIFIFGLIVGSFLNCIIWRVSIKKSFLKGRSICPKCKHQLNFFDLIPLFSFLALKGKCRYCQKKISWQYPLVELATGFIFLLVSILFWNNLSLMIFLLIIFSFLIIIFVYDLKHLIIPDNVLVPAIIIAALYRIIEGLFISKSLLSLYYLLSIAVPCGFFLLIYLLSKGKWIGFGDVKLAILLGLILGWPNILLGLFLSYLIGGIIGIGLVIISKKQMKSEVPFAPFLIAGTMIAVLFGTPILNWYLKLIR